MAKDPFSRKPRRNIDRPKQDDSSLHIRFGSFQKTRMRHLSIGSVILGLLVTGVVFFTARLQNPVTLTADQVEVCFTPQQSCRSTILRHLDGAKQTIYVQAYSFTSKTLAAALINAQKRGVKVTVIADKSQRTDKHSQIKALQQNGIRVLFDQKPAIAHNKIMIIDKNIVITGSYNWTNAAEDRNAENLLVLHQAMIAQMYLDNFQKRLSVSVQ